MRARMGARARARERSATDGVRRAVARRADPLARTWPAASMSGLARGPRFAVRSGERSSTWWKMDTQQSVALLCVATSSGV